MKFRLLSFFAVLFLAFSCAEEFDNTTIVEEPFTPVTNIEISSLLITVQPKIPFSCKIGGQTFYSEDGELLLLKNLLLDKEGSSLVIKSEGYYDQVRYVVPSIGANLYVEVGMISKEPQSSITTEIDGFNAKEGGTIEAYGSEIVIEPNALVDESGNIYEGDVSVYAFSTYRAAYITAIRSFPQNFQIHDEKGRTMNLAGGLDVIMEDEQGMPLFIKEGTTAKASIKITTSPGFEIPDVLDMIVYIEDQDDWVSMGQIEKVDDRWVGEISHFGHIHWGIQYESRVAHVKVKTVSGVPIPNKMFLLYTSLETPMSLGFSDSKGNLAIHVPVNVGFGINTVLKNIPDPVINTNFDPVASDDGTQLLLEDIELDDSFFQVYNGNILDCNSSVIKNSAIIAEGQWDLGPTGYEAYYFSDENGYFNYALQKLPLNNLDLKGFDFDAGITSEVYSIPNTEENHVNFGNLVVCDEYDIFVNYTIENEQFAYAFDATFASDLTNGMYESIIEASNANGANSNNQTRIVLAHENTFEPYKTYPIRDLSIQWSDGQKNYAFSCSGDCNHTITITRVKDEYYEGVIKDTANPAVEVIIGVFRIPR